MSFLVLEENHIKANSSIKYYGSILLSRIVSSISPPFVAHLFIQYDIALCMQGFVLLLIL